MALTQRHKFSVCEQKHAVNTLCLYAKKLVLFSGPLARESAQFTDAPESFIIDAGCSLLLAGFPVALM